MDQAKQWDETKHMAEIGSLAAGLVHGLRNPLAAISLANQNIRRKKGEQPIDKHIDSIEKKIAESEKIISNFLFCARLRMPNKESVNIASLIDECLMEAKKACGDINVTKDIDSKQTLQADRAQLKELFYNVICNAFEAMSTKENALLSIKAQVSGGCLDIIFKDNGNGLTPEALQRAKEPFFTTKAKGAGLGLTICQKVLTLHQGELTIDSVQGAGTTVTLRLPN